MGLSCQFSARLGGCVKVPGIRHGDASFPQLANFTGPGTWDPEGPKKLVVTARDRRKPQRPFLQPSALAVLSTDSAAMACSEAPAQ